jgi:XRE family transcriptional regulator, aerobic/anaerobic benzoate catabolism transcriptional regulator
VPGSMSTGSVAATGSEATFPEIGERLRAARARLGMTRRQLAACSSTSERYLAQLEAGTANPSLGILTALAGALDLGVADLMPLRGERDEAAARMVSSVRRLPPERVTELTAWLSRSVDSSLAKADRLVLVGLRGSGKTSLGARLADRLGFSFCEISHEVEQASGGALGLLIELAGRGALHRYESEVWEEAITGNQVVIAAPGGVVADGALYSRVLETAHSIWLEATPEDHMARVERQGDFRPMGRNRAAMADLRSILEARSAEYARSDAKLDTSRQGFEETLDLLETQARALLSGRRIMG